MLGDTVERPLLVRRMSASVAFVALTAAAGYGKTTLLRLWERADPRPFVWVRDAADAASVMETVRSASTPTVLVIDDADRPDLEGLVAELAELTPPPSWTIALASRSLPDHVDVSLRMRGALTLTESDLAFDLSEAADLLSLTGSDLDEAFAVTEGWPAGLRLVSAAHADGLAASEALTGADRVVRRYVHAALTRESDAATVEFLRACAAFPLLSAGVLDAALDRSDSTARLSEAERRHLFVRPLDREGRTLRMHGLIREALFADLHDADPAAAPRLRRRGAEWLAEEGRLAEALPLLLLNGDRRRALELIERLVVPLFERGGIAEIVGMLREIGRDVSIEDAYLAAMLAYTGVMTGDEIYAGYWSEIAERLVAADPERREATIALLTLRAHRAPQGIGAMRDDAERVRSILTPADRPWLAPTLMLCGIAAALSGEDSSAADTLDAAIRFAEDQHSVPSLTLSLTERALLLDRAGSPVRARALLDRAVAIVEGAGGAYPHAGLAYAARALNQVRAGGRAGAQADLQKANRYRPLVGAALPWLAVQLRLAMAGTAVPLGEDEIAATVLDEADDILRALPDPGVLQERLAALRRALPDRGSSVEPGAGLLSSAELRLLPMLTGHRSLEQIGRQLHLSRNTIKTQAASLYRKLGVTSRADAVERAEALGLIPPGRRAD